MGPILALHRFVLVACLVIFPLLILPLAGADRFTLDQIADEFPSRGFEHEIEFWTKIFGKYDGRHVIFHDRDDLRLIYKIKSFHKAPRNDRAEYRRQKEILEAEARELEKAFQEILRYGPDSKNLGSEHRRVMAVLQENGYSLSPPVLRRLSENYRYQRGVKDQFLEGLIRSGMYLDYIRKVFDRYQLPPVLALMPHVESSFNYNAYSKAGAAGIWQFTRSTGLSYLRINSYVDERLDPIAATDAAARKLSEDYRALGSWPLAVTAYNHGKYGMLRAKEQHGSDMRRIVDNYKSRSFGFASRNFYPELLAAIEIHHNYKKYFGVVDIADPLNFDTVRLDNSYDLGYFTSVEDVTPEVILAYNPHLKDTITRPNSILPAGFDIRLPVGKGREVEQVLASATPTQRGLMVAADGSLRYRVERGDSLGLIASRFSTSTGHLQRLNGIRNPNRIYPGQVLLIARGSGKPAAAAAPIVTAEPEDRSPSHYVVRRGDTLAAIAARLGTTTAALQRANNIRNPHHIRPGQKLTVPAGSGNTTFQYRVVRGDTLGSIASRHGTTVSSLIQLNRLRDADSLRVGQVLTVSGTEPIRTYTVRQGDTLAGIAGRFGTSVSSITAVNEIGNVNRIRPGQQLLIP